MEDQLERLEKALIKQVTEEIVKDRKSLVHSVSSFTDTRYQLGLALRRYQKHFKENRCWVKIATIIAEALGFEDHRVLYQILACTNHADEITPLRREAMLRAGLDPATGKSFALVEKLKGGPDGETAEEADRFVQHAHETRQAEKRAARAVRKQASSSPQNTGDNPADQSAFRPGERSTEPGAVMSEDALCDHILSHILSHVAPMPEEQRKDAERSLLRKLEELLGLTPQDPQLPPEPAPPEPSQEQPSAAKPIAHKISTASAHRAVREPVQSPEFPFGDECLDLFGLRGAGESEELLIYLDRLYRVLGEEASSRYYIGDRFDLLDPAIDGAVIEEVLRTMHAAQWHHFHLQTGHIARLAKIQSAFTKGMTWPRNLSIGTNIESHFDVRRIVHFANARPNHKFLTFLPFASDPRHTVEQMFPELAKMLKIARIRLLILGETGGLGGGELTIADADFISTAARQAGCMVFLTSLAAKVAFEGRTPFPEYSLQPWAGETDDRVAKLRQLKELPKFQPHPWVNTSIFERHYDDPILVTAAQRTLF